MTPPLLPTLMMAVILGAASYLCHEPAAPARPAPVLATAVAAAPDAVVEAPFIPAPLAFSLQFPQGPVALVAEAEPARAAPAHRAARPARLAAPRREAPRLAGKVPEGKASETKAFEAASAPVDRPLPFAAEETTVAASDDGLLPALALPFAPTIQAVRQASAAAGTFVGEKGASLSAGTASLGAAVSGWVGALR